jgi:hypothetical protein
MSSFVQRIRKFWQPSNWLLAQDAHAFIAIAIVFGAVARGFVWWEGAAAVLAFAIIKEAVIDKIVENQPFFGNWKNSGAVDFAFYVLGVLIAGIVLLI